jgi:hypothetical protein
MLACNVVNFEAAFRDLGPAAIAGVFIAVGRCWAKQNYPTTDPRARKNKQPYYKGRQR